MLDRTPHKIIVPDCFLFIVGYGFSLIENYLFPY